MRSRTHLTPSLFAQSLLAACVAVGCSGAAFEYRHPPKPTLKTPQTGVNAAYRAMVDQREDRSVDDIYEGHPLPELNEIVAQEMMATGLFDTIVAVSTSDDTTAVELSKQDVVVLVEPVLEELRWETPNRKLHYVGMFAAAAGFGILGALAYSTIGVDVHAYTTMRFRFTDPRTEQRQTDRTYVEKYSREVDIGSAGADEVGSELIGHALKLAMGHFRTDLFRFARK